MLKLFVFIRAQPGITRDAFIQHYRTSHAPLAERLFPMFKAYRRNFMPQEAWTPEAPFHVVTEIEFADQAAYDAFRQTASQPEVRQAIRADEAKFLISDATRTYLMDTDHSAL